jgi:hypothetical protein
MQTYELIEQAKQDFAKVNNCKVAGITSFGKSDGGWAVGFEVVERKAIPDSMDIMGIYEVQIDPQGRFMSFERKKLRKRGDTEEP